MYDEIKEIIDRIGKYGICKKIKEDKELHDKIHNLIYWIDYDSINEKLYYINNNIFKMVKCKNCGKKSKYDKQAKKYNQYCSRSCAAASTSSFKNPETQKKAHQNIDYKKRQKKKQQAVKEKYGVDNVMCIDSVKNKVSKTRKSKTKKENLEINNKSRNTMKEKYGNKNYNVQQTQISFKQNKWSLFKETLKLKNIEPNFNLEEYLNFQYQNVYEFKCLECNNIFKFDKTIDGFEIKSINCKCQKNCKSSFEHEIIVWLKDLIPNIIIHPGYRFGNKKGDLECDIYLPEYNFGIEYNSLNFHSDLYKDKNYHQNKTFYFKERQINIVHIFEHLWRDKKKLLKSIIKNKLGLSKKLYARHCKIELIDNKQYKLFCLKNHIQGYCASEIKIGLFNDNNLVSIMSFSKPRMNKKFEYENIRTCFDKDINIVGGTEKMFKYFIKNYKPKNIISYCDISLFNGNSYLKMGYQLDEILSPNYLYFKGKEIKSRYQCQKHKLLSFLENYDPNITEYENMLNNKYIRCWDCGNYKFVWHSTKNLTNK